MLYPHHPPPDLSNSLQEDNLLKTSLDDFSLVSPLVPSSPQKKDLLSPLNNNVDCFNPNFAVQSLQSLQSLQCSTVMPSRLAVADCHTPPLLSSSPPLASCHLDNLTSDKSCNLLNNSGSSSSSYSCQTPVSILSHFEESKAGVEAVPGFPPQPHYISL